MDARDTPAVAARTQPSPPPEEDGQARWAAQVLGALHALDGLGGRALRLIYQQDLTQAQAAARLGVAEATIKTHVARALKQLAARLPGCGAGPG